MSSLPPPRPAMAPLPLASPRHCEHLESISASQPLTQCPALGVCYVSAKSLQSCPTLCDPMDCSPPGSPVHGIFQAKILERVAMPSSRGIFPTPGIEPMSPGKMVPRRQVGSVHLLAGGFYLGSHSLKPMAPRRESTSLPVCLEELVLPSFSKSGPSTVSPSFYPACFFFLESLS